LACQREGRAIEGDSLNVAAVLSLKPVALCSMFQLEQFPLGLNHT
jgi:hypothetical protein